MFFDKLFKKNRNLAPQQEEANQQSANADRATNKISVPSFDFVHTASNREKTSESLNSVLVLSWIAKKKGYDHTTNKFPKWFQSQYNIDFNKVMRSFISSGLLAENENIVIITDAGIDHLKKYDYVIYVHEHPRYGLQLSDFEQLDNLHKVQNADIAWGIFNQRILAYTEKLMWNSLAANYGNMADFLISEGKFEQAMDFIFAVAYLETSGMRDGNELTPISTEMTKRGWVNKKLPNGMPDIFLLEINNYYVTAPFLKVQKNLNLSKNEIRNRFINSKQVCSLESLLPFKYFEKEESFEFFMEAIQAGGTKGIFSLDNVSRKLKTNTPDEHSKRYFYASVENKVNMKYGK